MADQFNYYRILGIHRNANSMEIKRAYRKLAKQYHPDTARTEKEAEYFKVLKEAYERLSDPVSRKKHDDLLDGIKRSDHEIKRDVRKEERREKRKYKQPEKGDIHIHEPPAAIKNLFYIVGLIFSVTITINTVYFVQKGDWGAGWLCILILTMILFSDSIAGLVSGKAVLSDKVITFLAGFFKTKF